MTVATILSMFAWLTLLMNAVTLLMVISLVRKNVAGSALLSTVRAAASQLAVAVTVAASLGSLYLSEVGDLTPCRWCWIQRIAMYPLAFVLLIGWFTGDRLVRRYAVPMALLGLAASIWHYLLQQVPVPVSYTHLTLPTICSV